MDIQGYVQHPAGSPHYANARSAYRQGSSPSPVLRPLRYPTFRADGPSESQDEAIPSRIDNVLPPMESSSSSSTLDPALLVSNKDKRKSSPAILGLLGLSDEAEAQLRLHLSQHRNSIEAAMLLANFNRPRPPLTKQQTDLGKGKDTARLDDMSIYGRSDWTNSHRGGGGSLSSNCSVKGGSSNRVPGMRRHSFNAGLTWNKMSAEFIERSRELKQSSTATSPRQLAPISSPVSTSSSRVGWPSHDYAMSEREIPAPIAHSGPDFGDRVSPRVMYAPFNTGTSGYGPPQPHHPLLMMPPPQSPHPLRVPEGRTTAPTTPTRESAAGHKRSYTGEHHPPTRFHPYPYHVPPTVPPGQQIYYYPDKLPLPTHSDDSLGSSARNRRKKGRTEASQEIAQLPLGHPAFADKLVRDVEATRMDAEARPRPQKLRFPGDLYTPQLVRYNGQAKEGLCDTCEPGKWLQLKNSAFWYHKQFFHGISSVSGEEFKQPLETRWVEQDMMEGLCHQCRQWVPVSNVKRKNSVLWYRHAHKCHVYHKPKPTASVKQL